jgi:hypothetical protein
MRMPNTLTGLLILAGTTAQAGVVLEYTSRDLPSGQNASVERYYAQGGMMRIDRIDASGKVVGYHVVRDGGIYDINERTHTYTRIDPATMKGVAGAQNERLQAMLEQLPPEKRAQMQSRLAQLEGASSKVGPRYTDTGRSDRAGSYACRVWNEERSTGQVQAEWCVAPASSVPGGEEFSTAIKKALETVTAISAQIPQAAQATERFARFGKMNGVPVRSRRLSAAGTPEHESLLSSARPQTLAADAFAVPAGYVENSFDRAQAGSAE